MAGACGDGLVSAPRLPHEDDDMLATVAAFTRALRQRGMSVPSDAVVEFVRALALLGVPELYLAGRSTLVRRYEDFAVYDETFREFFGVPAADEPSSPPDTPTRPRAELVAGDDDGDGELMDMGAASLTARLREKRFADCTEAELEAIRLLMASLTLKPPRRTTRRRVAAKRGALDVRRTLRASLRTGGDPVNRVRRDRVSVERPIILMLDVSGSMSPYSRALLMFAHAALNNHPAWEAFCFGTRLTRLTDALKAADLRDTLDAIGHLVHDRDAGTRIGQSLRQFLQNPRYAGLARGAVVIFCSDGLEIGDPDLLRSQMRRLRRLAHQIIWLNPLKEDPRYRPIARGMAAALPSIDVLASGHDFRSFEQLAALLDSTLAAPNAAPIGAIAAA